MKIVIIGPTGVGKTSVAYNICKKFQGEIISADSRQVYKYLDIGNNKEIFTDVKTHLIDVITPDKIYSAYKFKSSAEKIIINLQKDNLLPVIVGGTNFYIKALVYNLELSKLKNKDYTGLSNKSIDKLQEILKIKDYKFYLSLNNSDRNNRRRLEKYIQSENLDPIRSYKLDKSFKIIQIDFDETNLFNDIEARTKEMIKRGLIDECRKVLSMGYKEEDPAFQMVGYKETILYIKGDVKTINELEDLINKDTYKLIKKQITFLNSFKEKVILPKNKIIDYIERENLTSK